MVASSPIAASFFGQTRSPDVDTVWQSDDGDTSYTQWVNLTGFSGGEGPYLFPAPFAYDSPAGSTVTAVTVTVTARQTISDGFLAVGLQAPDGTWLVGTAAAYVTLEPLALTGSWQTFTITATGLSQAQGGAGTAESAWAFYVANGDGTPAPVDESVRMSYVSAEFTLESGWPLRVVDAPEDVAYRIGPDYNPDGGLTRIVDPKTGRAWKQGGSSTGPGTQEVPADSFTVLDVEDGARWSDDGPASLHDIDGDKVYWNGSIGGAGVGDQWVLAAFGPITPAGATCTGIVVAQSIVTGATTGKTELCLADGTVVNTNTSGGGGASTFNSTQIADIIANGALVRRYGTVASLFASAAFELDRVELVLFFDDVTITARPLRIVDPRIPAVVAILPMIPAS